MDTTTDHDTYQFPSQADASFEQPHVFGTETADAEIVSLDILRDRALSVAAIGRSIEQEDIDTHRAERDMSNRESTKIGSNVVEMTASRSRPAEYSLDLGKIPKGVSEVSLILAAWREQEAA